MEGIHTLKDLLRKGDWLAKNRFLKCLLTVIIFVHSFKPQKFLRSMFKGKAYQFNCLSSAPGELTETLKISTSHSPREGDMANCLYRHQFSGGVQRLDPRPSNWYLLECLNPAQVMEFLGLSNNGNQTSLSQIKHIQAEACNLARQKTFQSANWHNC